MRYYVLPRWKEMGPDALPNYPLLAAAVVVVIAFSIYILVQFFMPIAPRISDDMLVDRVFADFCNKALPLEKRMANSIQLLARGDDAAHPADFEWSDYFKRLFWLAGDSTEPQEIRDAAWAYRQKLWERAYLR
ncbi:MAG: hypothetical protein WC712_00670 [Candidatus Brocadiia bacterium]